MRSVLVGLCLFLFSCAHEIPYKDDVGYLVSAIADSPELPVLVDGYICQDVAGKPGLCSVRIKQYRDLNFTFYERQYSYKLHIVCSKKLNFEKTFDVSANKNFAVEIPHKLFEDVDSFICIGEVFPQDREEKISAKFEVRVKVIDGGYVEREKMQLEKDGDEHYLILGKHALYSRVYDGEWKSYTKKTKVRVRNPLSLVAYSESYSFRVNSFSR